MKKIILIILALSALSSVIMAQEIPSLIFPPADTATNDSFPDFDWSDVAGATQYQIQVGKGTRWAYVADYYYGLYTMNASNLTDLTGGTTLYDVNSDYITLAGNYAYLSSQNNGLRIYDISNPLSFNCIATIPYVSSYPGETIVRDSLLYLTGNGLRIFNISNPASPALVGSWGSSINNTKSVFLRDTLAYVGSTSYLYVINIKNPAAPESLGSLSLGDVAKAIKVSGNYAYVANGNRGLTVVNISNPASPYEVGNLNTNGEANDLILEGSLIYLSDGSAGVKTVSVSNPAGPVQLGALDSAGTVYGIAKVDSFLYCANYNYRVMLLNVANQYNLKYLTQFNIPGYAYDIAIRDSFGPVEFDSTTVTSSCTADTFLGDGRHYWRARAGAGTWGGYSAGRLFTMDTQAPDKGWNNNPYGNQLINDPTPVVTWSTVSGIDRYQLQVCRDSSFAITELDTMVKASSCTLLTALGDGRHWWHFRGIDLAGNRAFWSDSTYFRLDTQAPAAPTGVTAQGASPSPWRNVNSFLVNYTAPYDSSGIQSYFYKIGAAPSSNYDTTYPGDFVVCPYTVTVKQQGVSPFYFWARDAAGNLDYNNYAMVDLRYDSTRPTGAVARSNEFSRNSSFVVSWSRGNDQGGSGLQGNYWLKFKNGGGSWVDSTNILDTFFVFVGNQGQKYYFEVSAWDSANNSEVFSGIAECSTYVDNTINFPVLVSPYNGDYLGASSVGFVWQKVPGYTGSRLQCAYDTAFASLVKDTVLAADSTANLTLSDNLYYWRAQGRNTAADTSAWSPRRSFRVDTQAPGIPVLMSPAADTLINDNTPYFKWNATTGAKRYNLLISPDSTFVTVSKNITTDSLWYDTDVTLPDNVYHWKVRAGDAAGNWSAYSTRRRFTIDTKAPVVPVLAWPVDNSTVTTNLPNFTWRASPQAVQYRLQVSPYTSFSPLEMDSATTDTAARPLWGLNDGTHYWRVKGRDAAGNWSAYSDYHAVTIAGLLQVALITPDTNSLWAPSQSVWIQFSKPINTGYIDTMRIRVKGKYSSLAKQANMYWERTSRTLRITPDTCFAANDTITVFIHGSLWDSTNNTTLDGNNNGIATGDSSDSYQMSFRTSHIGDYNPDGTMNASDLLLFAWGWNNYSRYYEAGPYYGTWPHQKIYPGTATKLDFEDLMGFIYSWNQSGGAKWGKWGLEGDIWLEADSLGTKVKVMSKPGNGMRALDAEINYDPACLELTAVSPASVWSSDEKPSLFLDKRQLGRITISAALWPEIKSPEGELFTLSFTRSKPASSELLLNYKTYDRQGKEISSGSASQLISSATTIPAVFNLGKALPNPTSGPVQLRYQIPATCRVKLEIFNIAGQRVAVLVDGEQAAGSYAVKWNAMMDNGNGASNGVYFYKLKAGSNQAVGKFTIIK